MGGRNEWNLLDHETRGHGDERRETNVACAWSGVTLRRRHSKDGRRDPPPENWQRDLDSGEYFEVERKQAT